MKAHMNDATIWRLLVIVLGAIAAAMILPVSGDRTSAEMLLAVAVFVAAVDAHFLAVASARREELFESVRVELNKIRRVYHISKNLAANNGKYRQWFTDVHGYVYEYLMAFAGKDFDAYDGMNGSFRKLSYHIYTIPEVETQKDMALYQDLLHTTATVAEARQKIKELWDGSMSRYAWSVVVLLTSTFVLATVYAMQDMASSRLVGGAAIAAAIVAADLLRDADTLSGEKQTLAERYVDNVRRLELGRRE